MENITIKLIDGTIDINKSKIKDMGIFKKMFDLNNTIKFIDYSDNEFMTKEAFMNAMTLCSDSDKNTEKVMDFLDLEYKYISFKKLDYLQSKNFDKNNHKDVKLYFKIFDSELTELPHWINSFPLSLVKQLVNKDNVNKIYTNDCAYHEYDCDTHLICHVIRPDILKYLFECDIDCSEGEIGKNSSNRNALYYTNNIEKFKMLVEYGFELDVGYKDFTILDHHKECGNLDIVRYIKSVKGIELSSSDEESSSDSDDEDSG